MRSAFRKQLVLNHRHGVMNELVVQIQLAHKLLRFLINPQLVVDYWFLADSVTPSLQMCNSRIEIHEKKLVNGSSETAV